MILEMLNVLENTYRETFDEPAIFRQVDALQEGVKSKTYQALMSRTKCSKSSFRLLFSLALYRTLSFARR